MFAMRLMRLAGYAGWGVYKSTQQQLQLLVQFW